MFFELHEEKKIAYKELTDADLGRSITSNQTHIGLFGDVFTYLPNSFQVDDCMLIYNDTVEFLPLNFDRIENPDGTFRSPKIRKGEQNEVSVVTFIRDRAKECSSITKWYLFWFGLKGKQPVFFLFNDNCTTYNEILSLNIVLGPKVKERITEESPQFNSLLMYLEKVVNKTGVKIAEELEIIAQTTDVIPKKYREYDINKAREIFAKIGKEGEFLVERYFADLRDKGEILSYKWVNENKESGLPYDFYFETLTGEIIYLDVKTTNYKFSQKMIFSSQEIEFATSNHNKYCVYRVYYDETGERNLKICSNIKALFAFLHQHTVKYEQAVNICAKLETVKIAILPTQKDLIFGNEISLAI